MVFLKTVLFEFLTHKKYRKNQNTIRFYARWCLGVIISFRATFPIHVYITAVLSMQRYNCVIFVAFYTLF